MNKQVDCYSPRIRYKPQWAYETPVGYRDEEFLIEFSFGPIVQNGILVRDLPVQLDDDAPYILTAVVVPVIGPIATSVSATGAMSMRDTQGNFICDDPTIFFGPYGMPGVSGQPAAGFPFEPVIVCDPGGTLLFNIQLSSFGTFASFLFVNGGAQILFFSAVLGSAGNGVTIQLIDPGAPNVPLSVALVGGIHVQVTLATDGAGTIISTMDQIAAILNSTSALANVIGAQVQAAGVAAALAQTTLTGGANSASVSTVNGTLIGKKRWKDC